MAYFIDHPRSRIAHLLRELDTDELYEESRRAFMQQIGMELTSAGVPVIEGVLPGQEAQRHLAHFHDAAHRIAARFVTGRPGIEWLWYLRRAQQLFEFNKLGGTRPYCSAIAEQICADSPAIGAVLDDHRFPLEAPDVYDLLYLRQAVGQIYNVHSAIRWAGKDAAIRFSGYAAPIAEPSLELRNAVRLYDERGDRVPMDPLARVGLTALVDMHGERNDRLYIPVVHELEHVGVQDIPGFHRLAGNTIDAGYGIARLDLSSFEPLFDQTIALDEATSRQFAGAAIGLISLMHPYLIGSIDFVASGVPIANIMCVGYELTTVAEFRDRCGWALAGAEGVGLPGWLVERAGTVDDVVETLSTIPISIHPPRRPRPLWPAQGGAALINWASMTRLFLDVIERIGAGGAQANQWGEMFEDRIQAWIDQSAWRPTPDLAAMQRRTLRRAGRKLTDVDALGVRDGQLLIVSCKSRALTDAFERGEYGEVRNARTQAEQALADLERVVADLRTDPVGDNFDFSGYREIAGVVVFPFLPYVGPAWLEAEVVPGLSSLVSLAELQQFLGAAD